MLCRGAPTGDEAVEGKRKLSNFGGVDLRDSEPLCQMVGLPSVEEGADMGFGIWSVCITNVGVIRHDIKIWFVQKGPNKVALGGRCEFRRS